MGQGEVFAISDCLVVVCDGRCSFGVSRIYLGMETYLICKYMYISHVHALIFSLISSSLLHISYVLYNIRSNKES